MRKLIDEIKLITKNSGRTVLIFEVIIKFLGITVLYPLFLLLFRACMKVSGYKYLTNEFILKFFLSPFTILSVILLILAISVYVLFEISCISVAFEGAHYGYRLGFESVVDGGIRRIKRMFIRENLPLLFYELIIFPFSNVAVLALVFSNLSIPDYILRGFGNKIGFLGFLGLIFLALFVLSIRYLFVICFMTNEDLTYKSACYRSKGMIRGRIIRSVLFILGWNVFFALIIGLVELLISGIVIGGVFLLGAINIGIAVYLTVMKTVKFALTLFLVLTMTFFSFFVITCMFFTYKAENEEILRRNDVCDDSDRSLFGISSIVLKEIRYPHRYNVWFKRIGVVLTVISIGLTASYIFFAEKDNPFDHVEFLQVPDITAHRGSSMNAPENTIAAFNQAIEDMADFIELDVHSTLDGTVVVSHDANLKRIAGVNRNIWQVTYGYLRSLDFGGWFSEDYIGEPIPTLDEVIELAKGEVKLNIEIKYNSKEPYLTERVVAIIEKNDFVEDCIVTSSSYDVLRRVKALNPEIKTGYVLSAAYGAYYKIDYVDVISINENFVNKAVVDAIHRNGKEIYVWTVNSPGKISSLANMGVDNIITDNPVMARERVYSRYITREIINILGYVFDRN